MEMTMICPRCGRVAYFHIKSRRYWCSDAKNCAWMSDIITEGWQEEN